MNAERRDKINKVRYALQDILPQIEELRDAEENALASMPESFQFGMQGEKMQDCIGSLDDAYNSLENVIEYLEEATA